MPVKLSNFNGTQNPNLTDFVVGYTNTNAGGERRWTIQQLANLIASTPAVMKSRAAATAWVNFKGTGMAVNGTAQIYDSYNISSVTRLANYYQANTGGYTFQLNFTTPMNNKNYAIVGTAAIGSPPPQGDDQMIGIKSYATNLTTSCQICVTDVDVRYSTAALANSNGESSDIISVIIYGGI